MCECKFEEFIWANNSPLWIDSIIYCNIEQWLYFLSPGIQYESYHTHPKNSHHNLANQLLCFRLLRCTPTRFFQFFRLLLGLWRVKWWIHVSSTVTKRHKTININSFKKLLVSENARHPSTTLLPHVWMIMQNVVLRFLPSEKSHAPSIYGYRSINVEGHLERGWLFALQWLINYND